MHPLLLFLLSSMRCVVSMRWAFIMNFAQFCVSVLMLSCYSHENNCLRHESDKRSRLELLQLASDDLFHCYLDFCISDYHPDNRETWQGNVLELHCQDFSLREKQHLNSSATLEWHHILLIAGKQHRLTWVLLSSRFQHSCKHVLVST